MPQVRGPAADPIIGLSYTVHDPDDWEVTHCFTEQQLLVYKSARGTAAVPQTKLRNQDLFSSVVSLFEALIKTK